MQHVTIFPQQNKVPALKVPEIFGDGSSVKRRVTKHNSSSTGSKAVLFQFLPTVFLSLNTMNVPHVSWIKGSVIQRSSSSSDSSSFLSFKIQTGPSTANLFRLDRSIPTEKHPLLFVGVFKKSNIGRECFSLDVLFCGCGVFYDKYVKHFNIWESFVENKSVNRVKCVSNKRTRKYFWMWNTYLLLYWSNWRRGDLWYYMKKEFSSLNLILLDKKHKNIWLKTIWKCF